MGRERKAVKLFEDRQVRAVWDEEAEKWWFSVVDVVAILSGSSQPRKYWNDLKAKLREEGSELSENIGQLKLEAADGKTYLTDVADTEQVLRLVQSVPSKKAEPFKIWLAKVGSERIDETVDPELSINRAVQNYHRLGYSENWINQRIKSIEIRKHDQYGTDIEHACRGSRCGRFNRAAAVGVCGKRVSVKGRRGSGESGTR